MTLHLTYSQKKKWGPFILQRDGPDCFYCMLPFEHEEDREFDHLDNDESHNYPENLVFNHHACNLKKRMCQPWQDKAIGKLKINQRKYLFTRGNTLADTGTTKELTSQQEINKTNMCVTRQFLLEHTITDDELLLKDVVNAIVDICQNNNNTGSQSAVYRYIDSLTNPWTGKYTLSANPKGQTIIRRRTEN